jgi:purine-binding chemotaxis protein CheW
MQLVCFFLGGQELAVPIDRVRETIDLRPITRVFHTPPSVVGILNLRGEILAVLDPGRLLGLGMTASSDGARIVIIEAGPRSAGLVVDALGSIREVESHALAPAPSTIAPEISSLLLGVVSTVERPISVLDAAKVLYAPELEPFTERSEDGPSEAVANG